ncbi:MAG: 4Fe-4S cluster-binding domain-containing protein [Paludibacteraceae bacterium]|nr:4Fe-4S cluster-binding domain-containing protein [Paludibacteraceae bacterium]
MLKVASYDIVFQEIPGEVTLALNLSNCPCHCPGCHSQHLWEDIGEPLDEALLEALIAKYASLITCVCFMGGDADPAEVARLAEHIKKRSLDANLSPSLLGEGRGEASLKTAWYSGRPADPNNLGSLGHLGLLDIFDFLKFGPYIEELGGLKSEKTNQRLYKRVGQGTPDSPFSWEDITASFWRNSFE